MKRTIVLSEMTNGTKYSRITLNLMPESTLPLILTLKLDQRTFSDFNQLRQQHFPPARNFLPAHVTLFHALPGEQETSVRQTLQAVCSRADRLFLTFPKLRFLGQGVAIDVASPALVQLHHQLAQTWSQWLTRQDQQGYRPHITIQNKCPSPEARQLYEQLTNEWKPLQGYGEGLLLWRYQGGPWDAIDEFLFLSSDGRS